MKMSMEFVNRICPNCQNPNYMVFLGDFSRTYKYKCMNCNGYFNDIDFEKELLQPVWKSECINTKIDMVEVVRCKDCVNNGTSRCPCHYSGDPYIDWNPDDDWFCADGEREKGR